MTARDPFRVIDGGVDGDTSEGRGAIVLVRDSWTDNTTWQLVRPLLAEDRVVVDYDRRVLQP